MTGGDLLVGRRLVVVADSQSLVTHIGPVIASDGIHDTDVTERANRIAPPAVAWWRISLQIRASGERQPQIPVWFSPRRIGVITMAGLWNSSQAMSHV